MREYFEREVRMAEKELTALKTSITKSAGTVVMAVREATLSVELALESDTAQAPYGHGAVRLIGGSEGFVAATLARYFDDISKSALQYETRQRWVFVTRDTEGVVVNVGVAGTVADRQTIKDGGRVVVDCELTVKGTEDFELEVL